jgi:transcriptional regulator
VYIPAVNAEDRPEVIHAFIDAHPFGIIVTASPSGLLATHLPLLLHRELGVLRGHIARPNPHHRIGAIDDALAIFSGDEAYITPSWYATKREHGKVVPTWNYVAVHVYGRLTFTDDRAFLEAQVRSLTDRHEASRAHPWSVSDAPREYIERQLNGIVGLEIEITRIEAKWKMSQNRGLEDIDGVIEGLDASENTRHVADVVKERKPSR